jgi:hypothetical protein
MSTKRKAKTKAKHPGGRPSQGVGDSVAFVRAPQELIARVAERAAAEGIASAEVWRRGAALYLEETPADEYAEVRKAGLSRGQP